MVMQSAVTKGSLWLPLVFSVAIAAAGCGSGAEEAMQQDMAKMRKDLDALNLAVHRSRGETETVQSQLERRTREQSGESARQMSSMNARIDSLSQRLESQSRPQGAPSGPRPAPSPTPTPLPSGGARAPGDGTAEESYKTAYLDFTKGNYTLAIAEFREFV